MPLPLLLLPLAAASQSATPWVGYYILGGAFGGGGLVGGAWYLSSCFFNSQDHADSKEIIEAMMKLGNYYQVDQKKDNTLAFDAYLKAAQLGESEALIPLERLGEEMCAQKQLLLSEAYKNIFKDDKKAKYWQKKAEDVDKFKNLAI
jgi:TPR repeat protein